MATIWFVLTCVSLFTMVNTASPLEHLFDSLVTKCKAHIRPRINPLLAVDVSVSYSLMSVEELDESSQALVSAGFFTLEWEDDFLVWNTTEHNDINTLILPWDAIWRPDLSVINNIDSFGTLSSPGDYVRVWNYGLVQWFIGVRLKTKCTLNMSKFPFDAQTCSLKLIQWSSFKNEVNFSAKYVGTDDTMFKSNSEWDINIHSMDTIVHDYPTNGEIIQQSEIKFTFLFHRKYLYCVVTNILPVMLLSVLNLGVFLLPPESGEKVSLSVSIVLSYAVFLTVINESLPESSDNFSIFGVYLLTMLFLKVMTTLSTIVVIKLSHIKEELQMLKGSEDDVQVTVNLNHDRALNVDKICFGVCVVATGIVTLVCFGLMIN